MIGTNVIGEKDIKLIFARSKVKNKQIRGTNLFIVS